MSRVLEVLAILVLWSLAASGIGIIGTVVGPGIIMLFHALIVGLCGALLMIARMGNLLVLPTRYVGALITCAGVIIGMFFLHSELSEPIITFVFLFAFFICPVYLVFYLIERIFQKVIVGHAA